MAIDAGKLRHIVYIQQAIQQQKDDGSIEVVWQNIYKTYASIEYLSAREFIASDKETSKISCRITIRYNKNITESMRIKHGDKVFNIEGLLPDLQSGIEYITIPCSTGVIEEDQPMG